MGDENAAGGEWRDDDDIIRSGDMLQQPRWVADPAPQRPPTGRPTIRHRGKARKLAPHLDQITFLGALARTFSCIMLQEASRGLYLECMQEVARSVSVGPLSTMSRFSNTALAFYHRLGYVIIEHRMLGDDDCQVLKLSRTT